MSHQEEALMKFTQTGKVLEVFQNYHRLQWLMKHKLHKHPLVSGFVKKSLIQVVRQEEYLKQIHLTASNQSFVIMSLTVHCAFQVLSLRD